MYFCRRFIQTSLKVLYGRICGRSDPEKILVVTGMIIKEKKYFCALENVDRKVQV